ncbi:MAG TPA: OmpH family outer membrane protein [Lentimicrobium sp.]|nr:OmpH family outer membrane protein [Lentimicrobium sp.]
MQEETPNNQPEQNNDYSNNDKPVNNTDAKPVRGGQLNLILTITNVVLLAGLAILYFIVIKNDNVIPERAIQKASNGSVTVAYVNSDSILAKYSLVKQMRDKLEANTIKFENELKTKQSSFEKDAAYFQEQVQKKTISESSAQEVYASLMNEQQKLMDLREKYTSELSKQEFDMNQLLLDSLNNFLKRYNKKMNFDYIFSYNRGGSILTANDSLDITDEVLNLLNTEFEAKK